MQLIYLFAIALVNNIDNIGIGIAFSVGGIKINLSKNILISLMAFIVSFIASLFGSVISHFLSEQISSIISTLILIFMGARMMYQSYFKRNNDRLDKINTLEYKEAVSIGTALALDDIGSSISSSLVGYSAFMISLPYFIVSLLIFLLSNYASNFFAKLNIGKKATLVAGGLMILMGIVQYFG